MTASSADRDYAKKPPLRRNQCRPEGGGGYAYQAACYLLEQLSKRGTPCRNVAEAIRKGHLTDLDWCMALNQFREGRRRRGRPSA